MKEGLKKERGKKKERKKETTKQTEEGKEEWREEEEEEDFTTWRKYTHIKYYSCFFTWHIFSEIQHINQSWTFLVNNIIK